MGLSKWQGEEITDWEEVTTFHYPALIRVYEDNVFKYGAVLLGVTLQLKKLDRLEDEPENVRFNSQLTLEKALTKKTKKEAKNG